MPADPGDWLRPVADGCVVKLWVGPGAARAGVVGVHAGALRIRVTAPPAGGAANREVLRLLGSLLHVRARDLALESGASGRRKSVRVRGLRVDEVRARLPLVGGVDTTAGDN
jgi:uncharacterized protein (TIGR00251 family)